MLQLNGLRRAVLAVGCGALLLVGVACTERESVRGGGRPPVAATAYPNPPNADGPVAVDPPEDLQQLPVAIVDGRFDGDRYDVQARATRIVVTAHGGPYTLSIEDLLGPSQVPADGTATFGVSLPKPGEYTMQLAGGGRAVLNVRPPGAR